MYKAEQGRLESANADLKEQNGRLQREVEKLGVGKEEALRHCQKLREQLDHQEQVLSTVRVEYEARIQECEEAAKRAELESAKRVQDVEKELTDTVVGLLTPSCSSRLAAG